MHFKKIQLFVFLVIFGLNLCHTIMRYALRKTYVLLIPINMVLEKFLYTSIFKSHIDKNTFNGKCIVMTLHLGQKEIIYLLSFSKTSKRIEEVLRG